MALGHLALGCRPKGRGSLLSPITLVSEAQAATSPCSLCAHYCSSPRGPFSRGSGPFSPVLLPVTGAPR